MIGKKTTLGRQQNCRRKSILSRAVKIFDSIWDLKISALQEQASELLQCVSCMSKEKIQRKQKVAHTQGRYQPLHFIIVIYSSWGDFTLREQLLVPHFLSSLLEVDYPNRGPVPVTTYRWKGL